MKTKYDPDTFPQLAYQYAREGYQNKEIAVSLGINESTMYEYIKRHPEFADALKRGKAPVDVEVEQTLLKRAKGYTYEAEEIEYGPGGNILCRKTKTEHVKPDTTAMIFWLKNRRPDRWRDKQDVDHSGSITVQIDKDDKDV